MHPVSIELKQTDNKRYKVSFYYWDMKQEFFFYDCLKEAEVKYNELIKEMPTAWRQITLIGKGDR